MVCSANTPDQAWVARERERVRKYRSKKSAAGRDIGRLPAVFDPVLKAKCARLLKLFAFSYFPKTFKLAFSRDHDRVIAEMQRAFLEGGRFALAMPRGSGKTSLCVVAAIWALIYGYHPFVLLIGATGDAAKELLDEIKTELMTNELLARDFPEVCFPIRALEGITNRAKGQRFQGQPTHITWKDKCVVLPTIPGSPASGAIVHVAGITGRIRGRKHKTADGRSVRPTLVIPDDPQTDQSAKKSGQVNKRIQTIVGTCVGLAGPGETITIVMPCTVIEENDLAHQMLNNELFPEWNGITTKTLYSFPTNLKLWEEYAEIRRQCFRQRKSIARATKFYRDHRAEMDAGADVAWPERFEKGEISGLQRAMNLYYDNRATFQSEYQNDPLSRNASARVKILTVVQIAEKLNRVPRGCVPAECSVVTASIDVPQSVLYWMVCGFSQRFGGGIIDYGTWPDQSRAYFTLSELGSTIEQALPEITSLEGRIYAAGETLVARLCNREFMRVGGTALRISRVIIDSGWQTDTIYKLCRQSTYAGLLTPSHGKYIGAKETPINDWKKQEGDRRGDGWTLRKAANQRGVRHVTFDSNHFKSFTHERLSTAMGDPTSLALFGDSPAEHRMLADHLGASETPTRVEAKGRVVDEWSLRPERPDNHLLDCLGMCLVAGSMEGCVLTLTEKAPPPTAGRRIQVSF